MAFVLDNIEVNTVSLTLGGYPYIQGDSSAYLQIVNTNGNVRIGTGNSSYCHFFTDRGGYYFDKSIVVDGGAVSSYNEDLRLRRTQSDSDMIKVSTDVIDFHLDGVLEMRLDNVGKLHVDNDIIAFSTTTSSDVRLKQNIEPISDALSIVDRLKGVHFEWKKDGKKSLGFIAQEVEEVLPELVTESEDLNDGEVYKGVNYSVMVAVLVEAVKEQQKQIDELKKLIK
jgi:hypothetical protein